MSRACIIGWPVSHSRSPLIHGFWLKEHGLAGDYVREPVTPEDAFGFFRTLFDRGYMGGNVTLPHKQVAFAAADRHDEAATAIGAVNTFWREGNSLVGGNTDAHGFAANLTADCPYWRNTTQTALVLGAGGAALAIIHALKSHGIRRIVVANRSLEKAEAMKARFGASIHPLAWEALGANLAEADLLINTTSLGMAGQPPLDLPLDDVKPTAIVSDIVYAPLKTALLEQAEARGLATSSGLGMLLHQAAPGFERWFGIHPAVTPALVAHIRADLERAP